MRKKRKFVALILAILMAASPVMVLAETEESFSEAKEQSKEAIEKLNEMPSKIDAKAAAYVGEKGSAYSNYGSSGLSPEYYAQTGKTPYTKSKIGEGLLDTALAAAFSIGTAEQASSSAQLKEMAADLEASGVPEYKETAKYLRAEAACIDASDQACAETTAAEYQSYYKEKYPQIDANYKPTESEKSAMAPFAKFATSFLGRIASKLTDWGLTKLMSLIPALAGGGPLGVILGALAGSLIENLGNSEGAGAAAADKISDYATGGIDKFASGKSTDEYKDNSGTNTSDTNYPGQPPAAPPVEIGSSGSSSVNKAISKTEE